ncbi:MAG: hypothetical protein P8O93_00505 [Flavobacteriaceae bacterium]|jgi:hypothetical protein|nr:hypothetical protein [Flavobacteriaceae bacterium]MDG1961705.1 hypothetical protein [Flavobacteriaceae bacterium]
MFRKILIVLALIVAQLVHAQGTTSPYSFFGIGNLNFRGTIENRSMAGLSTYSDSIHLNLQNPAGLSQLKLVNYSIASSHKFNTLNTTQESQKATTTTLDYMAIGVPMGKFGASFGLLPLTTSGYKLENVEGLSTTQYSGTGGMNKVFLGLGYQVNSQFSLGLEANYNFGKIENNALSFQDEIQLGTEENNQSDLLGFSVNLGAQYQHYFVNKLKGTIGVTYTPETNFVSENQRTIATVLLLPNGNTSPIDSRDITLANTDFTYPSQLTLGAGLGKERSWFLGGEVSTQKTSNLSNRTVTLDNVVFEDAVKYRIGGFVIPDYNSFSSVFKRVVYRGGFRFEETGININGNSINEFGISFGLGINLGRSFSNLNLGVEVGKRGTQKSGLVEESFVNIFMALSLNDKWFEKRLYD